MIAIMGRREKEKDKEEAEETKLLVWIPKVKLLLRNFTGH